MKARPLEIAVMVVMLASVTASFWLRHEPLPRAPWPATGRVFLENAFYLCMGISGWIEAPRIFKYNVRMHRGIAVAIFLGGLGLIAISLWPIWTT
jgi:hypothetical protein